MIRSPAGFDGEDRIKRYLDYYQPSYGVMMLSAGQFSPALLFASGEQGVWYDPSDMTTLFQDSAGTIPVTAVEQPVGLVLDKSGRGNHASQSTSASRPVLSARVNLLTYSEQFDNAAWTKENTTVTANAVAAPNGLTTADKVIATAVNGGHGVYQGITTVTGVNYTFSGFFKSSEYGFAAISGYDTTTFYATFNLTLGTVVNTSGLVSSNIISAGDGWYFCSISRTVTFTGTSYWYARPIPSSAFAGYTGDGTSGIYIWGADLRPTNQTTLLPAYQRIAAATDYDTTGFPYYLRFDGTDDSMATGTINPGSVDKVQVFAGVRKLSDAAIGILAELSASHLSNAGTFTLLPNSSTLGALGNRFAFASRGSAAAATSQLAYSNSAPAPTTQVWVSTGDISGDLNSIRLNGAASGVVATDDQGTGNYLSYPLYIGRRGGTSLPFNGQLYSLIVRFGANLDATMISNTETWVNGKTLAY